MTLADLERFLDNQNRSQRERLRVLREEWSAALARMDDSELLRSLRLIRKKINSKKLVGERDALIGEHRRDGLAGSDALPPPVAVEPPAPDMIADIAAPPDENRHPELEALIAADPRVRDPYLVYRDWLEGRGLVTDGRVDLGPLADCDDMLGDIEWHLGFVRKCRLRYTSERFNGGRPNVTMEQALGWLLDAPGAGRFVRDLTIGLVLHDDNNYAGVCRAIGARARPALEKLYLGDFGYEECELNWSHIGDASPMWPALPRLRELTLRSHDMTLGDIALPELRRFSTVCGGLGEAAARSIAAASWPKIEILDVQYGPQGVSDPAVVAPILDAVGLDNLRHLGLTNCNFTDAICEALPGARIARQLEVLDVSMGTMGVAGARALATRRSAFPELRRLIVADNYLSADALALLDGFCAEVIIGDQRDDDGDPSSRYGSAYE